MLILRARRAIINRRVKYGWPVIKICSHFNINRDTFYYHWNNYQKYGWEGLEIASRKPDTPISLDLSGGADILPERDSLFIYL
jgi:DNA invertase Pin-like site-specific DNA recombinase